MDQPAREWLTWRLDAFAEPGVPRRGRRPAVADRPALVPAGGAPLRRVPGGGGVREGGGGELALTPDPSPAVRERGEKRKAVPDRHVTHPESTKHA
jgi:hypothetical protein